MFNRISSCLQSALLAALILFSTAGVSTATVITLGEQDFNDGDTINLTVYNRAQSGEPRPFNAFRGRDNQRGSFFSQSWSFNFAPDASITAANLMLGLFDHDCRSAICTPVGSFEVDGTDLTGALNAALQTTGTFTNASYDIVTLDLGSILGDLADGIVNMSLTMQAVPEEQEGGNGMGLDFAKLTIVSDAVAVSEPGSLAILGLGLAGLGFMRRRKAA